MTVKSKYLDAVPVGRIFLQLEIHDTIRRSGGSGEAKVVPARVLTVDCPSIFIEHARTVFRSIGSPGQRLTVRLLRSLTRMRRIFGRTQRHR